MGRRGPRKTPTELLIARGSDVVHRHRKGEPLPAPVEGGEAPSWLSDDAKSFYVETLDLLTAQGVIGRADLPALAILADTWSRYQEARRGVDKNGIAQESKHGGESLRPCVRVMNQALDSFIKLSREFGLTPASRPDVKTCNTINVRNDPAAKYRAISLPFDGDPSAG